IWWSFYKPGVTFASFLSYVISRFGVDDPEHVESRLDLAIRAIRENPLLVVLDGFERVEEAGENPQSIARFLHEISAVTMRSRVLIVSRETPREMEDLARVKVVQLRGLEIDDAVAFLASLGVVGDEAEVRNVAST